ncbi:MAG: transposase [Deinococcota bacterium]
MSIDHSSTVNNSRSLRGFHIALNSNIKTTPKGFIVPSQSSSKKYVVAPDLSRCTCIDYEQRQKPCKHIYAVQHYLEGTGDLEVPDKLKRPTYPQRWAEYNASQVGEKANFLKLLHGLCEGITEPPQRIGRPRLSFADMVFACAFKIYSGLSGRRFGSDLEEARGKGYITKTPHFNSLYNYFDKPSITPLLHELITVTALPLKSIETDFAVDSTGISNNRFVRWFNVKHGKELDYSDWLKLHLMCGVQTNIVTSVELSSRHEHDSNYFKPLVDATAQNFELKEVSADLAYSSHDNLYAVTQYGAMPYIPFKKNTTGKGAPLWQSMYHYFNLYRSEFLEHYHKRSNVESTFSMIKGKFGDEVKGKSDTAQLNEVLFKVLCHNICVVNQAMFELGIQATFCADHTVAQKG